MENNHNIKLLIKMPFALCSVRGLDLCAHCVTNCCCFRQEVVMKVCLIRADSMALTGKTTIFIFGLFAFQFLKLLEEPYFIIGKLDL